MPAFESKECSTLASFAVWDAPEPLNPLQSLSRLGLAEESRADLVRAELEQIPTGCKVIVAHWGGCTLWFPVCFGPASIPPLCLSLALGSAEGMLWERFALHRK